MPAKAFRFKCYLCFMIEYIDRQSGEIKYEIPPGSAYLRFLYDSKLGSKAVLPLAKRKWLSRWYGRKMNRARSTRRIADFVREMNIDMSEAEKNLSEFRSFNEFFYRKLKPGSRPIADGLVSPGDGKILAFENVAAAGKFFVKGSSFTLTSFFRDAQLAEKYAAYSMAILRLAPNDYHRYHFPYGGVPSDSKKIKGHLLSVSPIALAKNFTRVFLENKREICVLKTERDDVVICPVGATMVGSIHSTYQPEVAVERGEEMGYFSFGGSTVVVLFSPRQFRFNQDLLKNTGNGYETYLRMGEQIAEEV